MSALTFAAIAIGLLCAAVLGAHLMAPPTALSGSAEAVAGSTARWRLAGSVVGVLAAVCVLVPSDLGSGALLAAPVCAMGALAGTVIGEMRAPRPSGPVRSAALQVRRVRDHLPRGLTRAVAGALGVLALLLVVTTAMASADDLGRPGRALVLRRGGLVEAHTPWAGSWYAVPLAAVVVVGVGAAAYALNRVVRRPLIGDDLVGDDLVRRRSAEAVVAAVALLAGIPLAGTAAVSAAALLGTADRPEAWTVLGWVLITVIPAALALAGRAAVLLVVRERGTRAGTAAARE